MKTNTTLPRLRFPDFKGKKNWKITTLEKIAELNPSNESLPNSFIYIDLESVQDNKLLNRKKVNLEDAPSRAQRLLRYEDVLFQTVRPYQKNNYFFLLDDNCDYVASTGYAQLRAFESASYLNQYIYNERFVKRVLQHCAGGNYPAINSKNLAKIRVEIPSLLEQKKIADCLASLDTLLSAESQQLDSLQIYKAGLLQQLFPAEGETAPRVRFDGFKGRWKETTLNSICEFVRGPFGGALKKDIFVKSGYAVYEQSHAIHSDFNSFRYFIDEEKFDELKRFKVKADDLIMSCSGTMGKFSRIPAKAKEGVINQALLKLTVKNNYDISFIKIALEMPLNQNKLLSQSAGGAVKNVVGVKLIKQITIAVPSVKEQTKIAKVISSLDNLIEAQASKIETLKQHKQGLMQQLFP